MASLCAFFLLIDTGEYTLICEQSEDRLKEKDAKSCWLNRRWGIASCSVGTRAHHKGWRGWRRARPRKKGPHRVEEAMADSGACDIQPPCLLLINRHNTGLRWPHWGSRARCRLPIHERHRRIRLWPIGTQIHKIVNYFCFELKLAVL